jgi:pilus assembly protein CpaE
MSHFLRLVIVDPERSTCASLRSMLLAIEHINIEAECSCYEDFFDVVTRLGPDVAVMAVDRDPETCLRQLQQLVAQFPECHFFVTSSSSDGEMILKFMRAGASEFLVSPLRYEDLQQALQRIAEVRSRAGDGDLSIARMIAVAGSAGGVGTTSVAVNLACALAVEERHSVALIDLDFCLGDIDVCLDTMTEWTFSDLVRTADRLDERLLRRAFVKHDCGLFLLSRPVPLHNRQKIATDELNCFINLLATTFSHVVFDLSKSYGIVDRVVLSRSDQVLLVTHLDLASLRNSLQLLAFFSELRKESQAARVVVNRVDLEQQLLSIKKVEEVMGRKIYWRIPHDQQAMNEARTAGIPLIQQAPRAAITRNIAHLAEAIAEDQAAPTGPLW